MRPKIKRPKPRRFGPGHQRRIDGNVRRWIPSFPNHGSFVWLPSGGTNVSAGSLRSARLVIRIAISRSIVLEGLGFLSRSRPGSEQSSSILRFCPDAGNESRRAEAAVKSLYSKMAKVYGEAVMNPMVACGRSEIFSEEFDHESHGIISGASGIFVRAFQFDGARGGNRYACRSSNGACSRPQSKSNHMRIE